MSSINFNQSAMVALNTLKSINSNLSEVQNQISTGKTISNAKDNAAIWAVSKVMESDVASFKTISDSLSLGGSTVAVARAGAEEIQGLLNDMKDLIVSAQESNFDGGTLQTEINNLKDQIDDVTSGAQLNGLNLINGTAGDTVEFLSSLNRSSSGVTASYISVNNTNLTTSSGDTLGAAAFAGTGELEDSSTTGILTFDTFDFVEADGTGGGGQAIAASDLNDGVTTSTDALIAGDIISFTIGDNTAIGAEEGEEYLTVSYRVKEGDFAEDIATGLRRELEDALAADLALDTPQLDFDGAGVDASDISVTITDGELVVENTSGTDIENSVSVVRGNGSLAALAALDVTDEAGAAAALDDIEGMIQTAIDAAAEFGSAETRIERQQEFVGELMTSLKAGISALTDTDMEEASARLQSLQVQQQLGVQALSIANSSPQSILSLFRG